ncbi:MAG: endonuclease/exonuclease/phosphatase family protein [Lewinella sp.]|nr:endonuclease/exonuclease/phosphatase family protein [Lewinella sp.]
MKFLSLFLPLFFGWFSTPLSAQEQLKVAAIGFYNFENLFDTIDQPEVNDVEFTPAGDYHYNTNIYQDKLSRLAQVVSEMATDITPDGLSLLGVAEIENRGVLEDFAAQPAVAARNYQIAHFDSPDRRGIDVALLYQAKYFKLEQARPLRLDNLFYSEGDSVFTRDILWVKGRYDDETIHVFVAHWPSRRGGEAASAHLRNAAALRFKLTADSIQLADPSAKIILMGDLNDDPTSPSVAKVIQAQGDVAKVATMGYYNPMLPLFRKGLGTTAYRDNWSLFDQIILNKQWLGTETSGWRFHQAFIFNPSYLFQKSGRFRGYPQRAFVGSSYVQGYSDHFPVYILLVKPVVRP